MSSRSSPPGALKLSRLLAVLRARGIVCDLRGSPAVPVSRASDDSRTITGGELFVAWQGNARDAHEYVADAAARGAAAAMVERYMDAAIPQLRVDEPRRAAAILAETLEGEPARHLHVTAVTGTNGKTTCSLLIRHILAGAGPSVAVGTLGVVDVDGEVEPESGGRLTTPGAVELSGRMRRWVEEGVTSVTIEASSHALDQHRLDGVGVDVAVLTNLSHDHLDYHKNIENYRQAKARILFLVRRGGGVVVNGGDPAWSDLRAIDARLIVTRLAGEDVAGRPAWGSDSLPDLVAGSLVISGEGSRFRVGWGGDEAYVSLPLLGRFNVENALSAIGAALLADQKLKMVAEALAEAPPIEGRLEVTVTDPVPVILDYAHTPHALERVLETLRPLCRGRLIVVFGAGGDRDRTKRAEMGSVAARGADLSIVTSDNPRTEDPELIVDEILDGMEGSVCERITDRREAIARALEHAESGDMVLLAGKGHERHQIVGTERRAFDERAVVRELLGSGRAA